VLLINPQWQGGQAVSDFGFGPWKRRKNEFVATFQDVFFSNNSACLGTTSGMLALCNCVLWLGIST
jgi:hypothetical protein